MRFPKLTRTVRITLAMLLILATLVFMWMMGPFRWRVNLEFGITVPEEARVLFFFGGPSRTMRLLDVKYEGDKGSVCRLRVDSAHVLRLLDSLTADCGYSSREDALEVSSVLSSGNLSCFDEEETFKVLAIAPGNDLGTYRSIHIRHKEGAYEVTLYSSWD